MPAASEPHLRCFVALDLPEVIREEAVRVQGALRDLNLFHGRFTAAANVHLTLKFLGEIPETTVAVVRTALAGIRLSAPKVRLGGAGLFAPRIVWVKLDGANELQRAVDAAVAEVFEAESRFMGHITIARVKAARNRRGLARAVEGLEVHAMAARAESFSLQQSTLQPEGPKYEVLQRFPLQP